MNVFYDLPTDLVLNVMDMLQPADLARLDSATACNDYRHVLHEAFKMHRRPLAPIYEPGAVVRLIWLCKRKVKIDSFELHLEVLGMLIKTEQIPLDAFRDTILDLRTFINNTLEVDYGLWLLQQEQFTCKQLKLGMNDFKIGALDAFASHPIHAKILKILFQNIDDSLAVFNRQDLSAYLESVSLFSFATSLPATENTLTFSATWSFVNLQSIYWGRLEPCSWLPQLIRLSPNLTQYFSNGAENAAAILQSQPLHHW